MVIAHAGVGQGWAVLGWTLELPLLLALAVTAAAWWLAVQAINARHPRSPLPGWRSASFAGGLLVLVVALQSPIDTFADEWFSVHMVQHLLIGFVAAPLFVLAGPMILVLRLLPGSWRRRLVLPLLHGRVARVMTFPALTWLLFAVVMWAAHFTGLFELALESEPIHQFEHLAFLASGYLYWLPALGDEPLPWRLGWSGRILYLFLGMPLSSVLGMVIVAQTGVLYPHYLLTGGAAALADQRLAGTVMWVGGDLITAVLIGLAVWAWVRDEARRARHRAAHAVIDASRG